MSGPADEIRDEFEKVRQWIVDRLDEVSDEDDRESLQCCLRMLQEVGIELGFDE